MWPHSRNNSPSLRIDPCPQGYIQETGTTYGVNLPRWPRMVAILASELRPPYCFVEFLCPKLLVVEPVTLPVLQWSMVTVVELKYEFLTSPWAVKHGTPDEFLSLEEAQACTPPSQSAAKSNKDHSSVELVWLYAFHHNFASFKLGHFLGCLLKFSGPDPFVKALPQLMQPVLNQEHKLVALVALFHKLLQKEFFVLLNAIPCYNSTQPKLTTSPTGSA